MIAAAFVKAFSFRALSQDASSPIQPMYGMPAVKYGPPPTPTPLPVPTDVIHNITGQEALIAALAAGALTIVFLWAGLKYFLGHAKK